MNVKDILQMYKNGSLEDELTDDIKNTIMIYAETKRIAENLTKKEMSQVVGVSCNYYINCVMGIGKPSYSMVKSLIEYLTMGTRDVYYKVFSHRSSPVFAVGKNSERFMVVQDNVYKEKYHEKMNVAESDFVNIVKDLNILEQVPM